MNKDILANIFGLHIGCMVQALFGDHHYKLYSVNREGGAYIDNIETSERLYVKLKDCKLLLKPLSEISEEDKRELIDKFDIRLNHIKLDNRKILHFSNRVERQLSINECVWLVSKGYDIGIVPREYVEIQEVE